MRVILLAVFALLASPLAAKEGEKASPKKDEDPEFKVSYSTKMDFDSSMIDGKMKAPTGFFLQGQNKQGLSNMVELRSHFKSELRQSKSGVRSAAK